jgi:hypothetical protein
MMYNKIRTVLVALMLCNSAFQVNADSKNAMPDRDALESAMKECETSLSNENSGRPDPAAMESCMTEKGFSRPDGGHRPPPPGHHE